ncbi:MAG: Glyoxalase-like domain protein [Pelotomaculum sp. PtaB.Bin104]|nr:MAG: Glyoxalase-like domain protein [Pelotomaculum sp. PtaB.Bin104]
MKFICPLIVVKDVEQSKNFYENVLKQKVKFDFGENVLFEGDFAIHLASHYQKLLGCDSKQILNKSNNFELYFEADNLEEIYTKLKGEHVEFIHKVLEQPWGQKVIRFYDLDAHIIEIGEPMQTVVLRLANTGLCVNEICTKTSMPAHFVESILNAAKQT